MTRPQITLYALAIAKKTLDRNRFKHGQKMTNCTPPNLKAGNRLLFKDKQHGKWDLQCRAGYRIFHIEHNGHYLHIENQATGKARPCNITDVVHELPFKLWNVDTMFGTAGKVINHLANIPTIPLNTT